MRQVNPKIWDVRPSPYDKLVADFLRKKRDGQPYRDFAPKLGLSRSTLHRLENLEQSITLAKLYAIAQRLRVTVEEILGWSKVKPKKSQ